VHDVVTSGVTTVLQRRLTPQAAAELEDLNVALADVMLSDQPDECRCCFETPDHRLCSGLIYEASMRGDHVCPSFDFIWRNFTTPVSYSSAGSWLRTTSSARQLYSANTSSRMLCATSVALKRRTPTTLYHAALLPERSGGA
jgi:hypothetical protein